MTAVQTPSVGRIVHYVSYGTPAGEYSSQCRAADITEVDPNDPAVVGLMVKNPTGVFFHPLIAGGCRLHEGEVGNDDPSRSYPGGSWHWPERT